MRKILLAFAIAILTGHLAGHAAAPHAPSMNISTIGQTVTVQWTAATGATGYVLYYAPYPNADYIGSVDMGTATSLTVSLPPGAAYFVAVRARNGEGDSPYSNIGTVIIPSGGAMVLNAGDYWEFDWSYRNVSSSSAGTTSNEDSGTFRITLGAPQVLGGRTAFPLIITGDAGAGKPIWNYLAADGPLLLGTQDGTSYSLVFRGDADGWKGAGFFAFFPPDRTATATFGSFQGNYRTVSAWVVARSSTIGGCTYYPGFGEICEQDYSSYYEREYHKSGVGPVGYSFYSSALFQGGGFISVHNTLQTIELAKSSRVADDGSYFTGSPWQPIANLDGATTHLDAAAFGGAALAFGNSWYSDSPPWLQKYDPGNGTWSSPTPSGAEIDVVLGASAGRLYGVGRVSSTATTSLLRFNAAASRWEVAGPMPTYAGRIYITGGGALANGELVAVYAPGTGFLTAYVYNPSTGLWRLGDSYSATVLSPAVAAVGNDVYAIGGYRTSSGTLSSVLRYRVETNNWQNVSTLPTPRSGAMAVAVGSKIYVIGGQGATINVPDGRVVEIFDTSTGSWSNGPTLPQQRTNFTATALDGRIYVIGGQDGNNTWLNTGLVLSP